MNSRYLSVAQRAKHRCEYCNAPEAIFNFPFEVEHVRPPRHGGSQGDDNLALACRSCNLFKSDFLDYQDPETLEFLPIFDPRKRQWEEHFTWDVETGSIRGLSPIGRATVACLRMNSDNQLFARLQWIRLGLFP